MADVEELEERISKLEAELEETKKVARESTGHVAYLLGLFTALNGLNFKGLSETETSSLPEPHSSWMQRVYQLLNDGRADGEDILRRV